MIPIIRATIAILIVAGVSLFLFPLQWLAVLMHWEMRRDLPQFWHRLVVSLIGVKVIVHGAPATERPLLMAANHSSWLDIPVLGSVAPVTFLDETASNRGAMLGALAQLQPVVPMPAASEKQKGAARSGRSADGKEILIVFAEGTSNAGNGVLPFQEALVEGACDVFSGDGAPEIWVQPLSIAYTTLQGLPMGRQFRPVVAWTGTIRFLPHAWTVLREYSIDAVVSFGTPVRLGQDGDAGRIANVCEESVRKMTANVLTGRDPF